LRVASHGHCRIRQSRRRTGCEPSWRHPGLDHQRGSSAMKPAPGSITRRRFVSGTAASIAVSRARGADSDPDLVNAMESVRKAIPLASVDPDRPTYHFHPPANWNNDPNGTLFYKGWHHLFYQLNPFGTDITNQHWGHARSKD